MPSGVAQQQPATATSIEQLVQLLRSTDPERILWRTQYERRLARAVLLAPTLEVCEALLLGEPVPRSRLDPLWARRYGL